MKKLSMAMAAVMLFVSCFVFTASAANTIKVTVNAPESVTTGSELTLSVDFSENTGFNTLGVKLTYPEGFTYVSADASTIIKTDCYLSFGGFEGETYTFYHDAAARTLSFVGASLYDIDEKSGSLFTAKFTAPKNAGNGEFAVEIIDNVYNEDEQVVSVDKVNGKVTVSGGLTYDLGDVNMDGWVDNIDGMFVLQYDVFLRDLTDAQLVLADVNGDGWVDNIDGMFILQYDVGLRDENFELY